MQMGDGMSSSIWERIFLSRANHWIGLASAIVALISAGFAIINQIEAGKAEAQAKQAQARAEDTANAAADAERKFRDALDKNKDDRDRVLAVYGAVIDALKDGDESHELLAASLVSVLVNSDTERKLQLDMLRVLQIKTNNPAVRADVVAAQFTLQNTFQDVGVSAPTQASVVVRGGRRPLQNANIDVFWCESSPQSTRSVAD
jgi:hypothetical protein